MTDSLMLASFLLAGLVILLPLLFHLTKYIGPKSDNTRKNETVEGGVRLVHKDPQDSFNVKYFLVGIAFLLFDVEVLFMFPWALNLRELGFFALLEMFVFVTILVGGLFYIYRSRILQWI